MKKYFISKCEENVWEILFLKIDLNFCIKMFDIILNTYDFVIIIWLRNVVEIIFFQCLPIYFFPFYWSVWSET